MEKAAKSRIYLSIQMPHLMNSKIREPMSREFRGRKLKTKIRSANNSSPQMSRKKWTLTDS